MTPKATFKQQLGNIYRAYTQYLDDTIQTDEVIAALRFKFSIVLSLIEDLYHGSVEQQQNALLHLSTMNIDAVNEALSLPATMLKKLIYSPETYAASIEYKNDEITDDLFI